MALVCCIKCNIELTSNQFNKHYGSKICEAGGKPIPKSSKQCPANFVCEHCNKECKNRNSYLNHEQRCSQNPCRIKPKSGGFTQWHAINGSWNKGKTKDTDDRILRYSKTLQDSYASGKIQKHGCFAWTAPERSANAKRQGLGGYNENAGRSKKFIVVDSFGNRAVLQSTYEYRCANILDELKIKWIRPKALKYDNRNYFADFYLTEYDIYLDPKNAYKAKLDKIKIDSVIAQNNVKVIVLSEEHLTKEFIKEICLTNSMVE